MKRELSIDGCLYIEIKEQEDIGEAKARLERILKENGIRFVIQGTGLAYDGIDEII